MFDLPLKYPWIGCGLSGVVLGFWTFILVMRHREHKETPSGEWIVYGIGWIVLIFFLHRAMT